MKLLNKLLCKLFGHKWRPNPKDMHCIRCGASRPKTFSEYLSYDSLIAKCFSKERYRKYILDTLLQYHEISQKEWEGNIKDIGNTVRIYYHGNNNIEVKDVENN